MMRQSCGFSSNDLLIKFCCSKWIPSSTNFLVVFDKLELLLQLLIRSEGYSLQGWTTLLMSLSDLVLRQYLNQRKIILEKLGKGELPMPVRGWDIEDLRTIQILATSTQIPEVLSEQASFILTPVARYPTTDEKLWYIEAKKNIKLPLVSWPRSRLLWLPTQEDSRFSGFPTDVVKLFSIFLEELCIYSTFWKDICSN